jgi:cytochrome c peroxidase
LNEDGSASKDVRFGPPEPAVRPISGRGECAQYRACVHSSAVRAVHNRCAEIHHMTTKITSDVARRLLAVLLLIGVLSCGQDPAPPETLGTAEQTVVMGFNCQAPGTGFRDVLAAAAPGTLPFVPLAPLKTAPNPVLPPAPLTGAPTLRADLGAYYIADAAAAIQLGKALFWDIQAGSDNKTSCATCHFQAGADTRSRHQLNPGFNGTFDGAALNRQLIGTDYPFVNGPAGALSRNVDNVTGSAGVRALKFKGLVGAVEQTMAGSDPVFGTMRQVGGVNAPTVVNAVYNHRNFGNGRAQPDFNGVNPWGARDAAARVYIVLDAAGNIGPWTLRIPNASLASQAVGPPLNPVEMSAAGRTFPDVGAKLLAGCAPGPCAVKPLALQQVDPTDSVLGGLVTPGVKGLNTTYEALIKKAFYPKWWNSAKTVKLAKTYTLMQVNFSMYWGLAIMLYEATLVSDAAPMDAYIATRIDPATGLPRTTTCIDAKGHPFTCIVPGDSLAIQTYLQPVVNRLAAEGVTIPLAAGGTRAVTTDDILNGLDLFEQPVPPPGTVGLPMMVKDPLTNTLIRPGAGAGCSFCHFGAETTSASVRNLTTGVELGAAEFRAAGFDLRMERMFMGVRTPAPAPAPGFWPTPPQPPPPVPTGTDIITYDNVSYAVTVTDVNNVPVTPSGVPVNTYDVGWYNIGVRPTAENIGLGDLDFNKLPLSWTEYFQTTLTNPATVLVPGGGLGCVDANGNPAGVPLSAPLNSPFAGQVLDPATGFPILSGGLTKTEATDVAGSFKTPMLRNVELNGPYFHTGGKATLRQAVELYDDGGNFANTSLSPLVRPIRMTEDQVVGLVAFLLALTDDRVRYERAPFDHPELPLPAGQDAAGADLITLVPAVGATGRAAPVKRFLDLNPFLP